MKEASVEKIRNTDARVEAPPSKAHTLRALIIASLAEGESRILRPLLGEDQLNVIRCLRALGIEVEPAGGEVRVLGGGGRFRPGGEELNVGESGVGMNFLTSAACLSGSPVTLTGAERITQRPIAEVVGGLRQLGCGIEYLGKEGFPPVMIAGGGIPGGTVEMSGEITSQYFSSVAVSAPCAQRPVTLRCTDEMSERPYFDITLQMMAEFGAAVERDGYREVRFPSGNPYRGRALTVEGDYSSASFFFLAAAVCGAAVTVGGLSPDTRQGDRGFLSLLERMGCRVSESAEGVRVEGEGGPLRAIEEDMGNMPDLVPPIAVAAAFAEGTSRFTDVAQLRVKECDRLAVMVSELGKMGITARCDRDSLTVEGGKPRGARIDPHNDHRIAMSFAAAGLATGEQVIESPGCVAKSFPDFWERFAVFG
ncbi:MAG: 3-phosphoshikimate 1-carboxyvinyltransferase [Planctomycetota bacterium]|jgi:3-phosphoshikimate 1-carboxyvinyltransferase